MRMRYLFAVLLIALLILPSEIPAQTSPPHKNTTGVSIELATWRKNTISNISYGLTVDIPASAQESIAATETITFDLKLEKFPLAIDFKANKEQLLQVEANGKPLTIIFENEHLLIDPAYLINGTNRISIHFTAGDAALTRKPEFVYTFLVPERARTFFPCFDQPDLKATFVLTAIIPADWEAISNGAIESVLPSGAKKKIIFEKSDAISTYLFSVVAGKFKHANRTLDGREVNLYYRETDPEKLSQSLDTIFELHRRALHFLETYTAIPYPFKKFDCIAIPGFQAGGMEHVGAIDYAASSLFLDKTANAKQKTDRLHLIAHETAHMWFGNLVTMKWFNDVWMKEVFANFMADKLANPEGRSDAFDLQFLLEHYPSAYAVDRTPGSHPIRQELDNLNQAGSLYGNIIYDKAPIVMNQLEQAIGAGLFRDGIRSYLKQYAFGNAEWADLISILKSLSAEDVTEWNENWINKAGRPVFRYKMTQKLGKISTFTLSQRGEYNIPGIWKQKFSVGLFYKDTVIQTSVHMNSENLNLRQLVGRNVPLFIVFNADGQGYGSFPIDNKMLPQVSRIKDPLIRASAYLNLYENVLNGAVAPTTLLTMYANNLASESEPLILDRMRKQFKNMYWQFITVAERKKISPESEAKIWQAMISSKEMATKRSLFQLYSTIAISQQAVDKLYQCWETKSGPEGIQLTEDDQIALASELAIRNHPQTDAILSSQNERIGNADTKAKFNYLIPSLSNDVRIRDAYFASLATDRKNEDWIPVALSNLHHPLRAADSEKYLPKTLELLEEVQRSGGVFFPTNWLRESFGFYQSKSAAAIVTTFVNRHPDYNGKLRKKILQETDDLFRAQKQLVGKK